MVQAIILTILFISLSLWAVRRVSELPDTTPHDIAVEEYEVALSDYNHAANTYKQCGSEYIDAAIYDWCAAGERLRVALEKAKEDIL